MWHSFTSYSFYSVYAFFSSLIQCSTIPPPLVFYLFSSLIHVANWAVCWGTFHRNEKKKDKKKKRQRCSVFIFLLVRLLLPHAPVCFPFNLLLRFPPPLPYFFFFFLSFGRCRILRECWVATLDSDEGHVGLKEEKRRRGVMSDGGGWSCLHTRETDKAALIILMSLWEKSWHSAFPTHTATHMSTCKTK